MDQLNISTKEDKKIIEVELTKISEKNFNPRRMGLIEENVKSLVESQFFPEIHLGLLNGELIVVDGYHRIEAVKRLGLSKIKAFITEYKTEESLKKDAINENVIHGVRLSDYDVAMSMFELFKTLTLKNQLINTSISDFVKFFNLDERKGRGLLAWVVLHKEILEDDLTEVNKVSNAESIISILNFRKENYTSITNETKYLIKQFYYRYGDLPRNELREAVNLFKENKDYNEEKKKELKELKSEEIKTINENEKECIFEDGKNERTIELNNDLLKEKNKETEEKTFQEQIEEINEKLDKEIEKTEKNNSKKIPISLYLKEISDRLMSLYVYQTKGKLEEITKDHIVTINDIIDRLNELSEPYYEKINKKEAK